MQLSAKLERTRSSRGGQYVVILKRPICKNFPVSVPPLTPRRIIPPPSRTPIPTYPPPPRRTPLRRITIPTYPPPPRRTPLRRITPTYVPPPPHDVPPSPTTYPPPPHDVPPRTPQLIIIEYMGILLLTK